MTPKSHAQVTHVVGNVTYLSGGTVYTSLGTAKGVQDSAVLFVLAGIDTLAVLKVMAVSSKSSACSVTRRVKTISVGAVVAGEIRIEEEKTASQPLERDTTLNGAALRSALPLGESLTKPERSIVSLQGRVSLQYYSTTFDNSSFNFNQPGVVLNVRATSPVAPITLDIYGNLRTLARGGTSPFSGSATNESRLYRFSLEYKNDVSDITVGRIIPVYAPSIGSIDGVSFSRKFGNLVSGASFGFQPPYDLQSVSTDTRKVAAFMQYQMHDVLDLSVTGAYARTYVQSLLDREAVSIMLNAYTLDGFTVYGYSDVDLRVKQGDQFVWSPSISLASFNVSYRVLNFLTIGAGADASRPVFPFSSVQGVPDSLLDRTLRSGATIMLNVNFANGFGAFNTYSPRTSDAGFGQEYMNNSSFYLTDAFSTGATVRASYMMNENQFTSSRGYGLGLQRNILGLDVTLRYQQNRYRVLQVGQDNIGQTLGADLMALISRHLSFVTSLDVMRGFGANSYSVFSELSWRF